MNAKYNGPKSSKSQTGLNLQCMWPIMECSRLGLQVEPAVISQILIFTKKVDQAGNSSWVGTECFFSLRLGV